VAPPIRSGNVFKLNPVFIFANIPTGIEVRLIKIFPRVNMLFTLVKEIQLHGAERGCSNISA
jgi:hypothetical protein